MLKYTIKRILSLIPILFIASVVVFAIIHLTPGDPATVMLGNEATDQQIETLRQQLNLNLPLYQQYFQWIMNVFQGNLGYSYFMDEPVLQAILNHIKPTISLAILAEIFAVVIAIPCGIMAAKHRGSYIDQSIMGLSLMGMAIPGFLLSLFLSLFFGVKMGWLPVAGYKPLSDGIWVHLQYLIMPAISLASILIALITRMTRSSMLEVLNTNYIKTVRAKGVKEHNIIYKHAFRNAFLPILTIIGTSFGAIIAGAVVIEVIFNIPGIGQLVINSVKRRDYALIQGVVLFITVSFVMINLITDLLYGVINPRVRLDQK